MASLTSNSFNIYHDDAVDVIIDIYIIFDIKLEET